MAITKYESYYQKIKEQLSEIRETYQYQNDSNAFAHWYLKTQMKMSEQEIAEVIFDGADDKGIDAAIVDEDNNALTVIQFKFPNQLNTINNEIDQGSVLKTLDGFELLLSNSRQYTGKNIGFKECKQQLENTFITNFRIIFVSYNKGVIANRGLVEDRIETFKNNTGSEVVVEYHDREVIASIYEKINRKNNNIITLKYKQMQSAYNVQNRSIDSHVGFVSGVDLVKAIENNITTIFDENIRLYEYGSTINTGINRTATSTDQADMFYFYNNGVVFICDKTKNSPASYEIVLEGASVVNGCQTMNVLYNAAQKGKLSNDVCLLVRIIAISDYSERMRITEFLNSQTPIRDSYFIANHPIVRDLQENLIEKGYFLERQVNEYQFICIHGKHADYQEVLQLEKVIQYYVGYWINKYASTAKRGKNALFDKNKIEELLAGITADRVIEAFNAYSSISEVLTMYRKMRRNHEKTEFSNYIGIDHSVVLKHIDEFRFINTGDIIITNGYANLKRKYSELGIECSSQELIIDTIMIIKEVISGESETSISQLTKNNGIFIKMQQVINNLTEKNSITI